MCYVAEDEDDYTNDNNDEMVFGVVKEDLFTEKTQIDEEKTLISSMNYNRDWIIDSGCTHHMNGDKKKFITLEYCETGSVRLGNGSPYVIKVKVIFFN